MHLQCGLDLRHNYVSAMLINEPDDVVVRKVLASNLKLITAFLA